MHSQREEGAFHFDVIGKSSPPLEIDPSLDLAPCTRGGPPTEECCEPLCLQRRRSSISPVMPPLAAAHKEEGDKQTVENEEER